MGSGLLRKFVLKSMLVNMHVLTWLPARQSEVNGLVQERHKSSALAMKWSDCANVPEFVLKSMGK